MGCNVVEGYGEARGENVCEARVFGSVSIGNLILCQMAQAKAGEWEVRKYKIGSVRQRLHQRLLNNFLPCPAERAVIILIPDCWLGHLFCSKNVL